MAYGHVPRPEGSDPASLKPRTYPLPTRARTEARAAILCIPFHANGDDQEAYLASNGANGLKPPPALIDYLASVFNAEILKGTTYPQRATLSRDAFIDYFLSYDLIAAFFLPASKLTVPASDIPTTGLETTLPSIADLPLQTLDLPESVAGFYYIKPNYPGRSSHNCNAGFVVPPQSRGTGLGGVLGQSYLHYAPKSGYRGSVFNLVYDNNQASLRIWDRLGFTRVGRIPEAGLLRRSEEEGGGEAYVDAWAIYKKF